LAEQSEMSASLLQNAVISLWNWTRERLGGGGVKGCTQLCYSDHAPCNSNASFYKCSNILNCRCLITGVKNSRLVLISWSLEDFWRCCAIIYKTVLSDFDHRLN
jgi:hypothetical protein